MLRNDYNNLDFSYGRLVLEKHDSTVTRPYDGLSKEALYIYLELLNCSVFEQGSGAPQLRANTQVFFSFLGSFPNDAFIDSFIQPLVTKIG